jgi:ABC-type cobalamin/Fe3+-siderophores transport system ATPase subunit
VAHITKFSVTGLAGRKGVYEQTLDRHLNIFFGLNGSGKTSLLKLLDSAMSGEGNSLIGVPFESAEVTIYSELYSRTVTRSIDLKMLSETKKAPESRYYSRDGVVVRGKPPIPWVTKPDDKEYQSKWHHSYLSISRMFTPHEMGLGWDGGPVDLQVVEEQLNRSYEATLNQVWSAYVRTLLIAVGEAQSQGLANILGSVLTAKNRKSASPLLDPDIAYGNLKSFLKRQGSPQILPSEATFKKRYVEEQELRSVVSDIDEVEKRIAEAMQPRTKLKDLIGKMFSGDKHVDFGDGGIEVRVGKDRKISLGQLSSGEKQVLRLLIEMLRADKSTILIDEPELSMHVDWQRELIASMQSLNKDPQIIAATHSPEIMADVDDSLIFRL